MPPATTDVPGEPVEESTTRLPLLVLCQHIHVFLTHNENIDWAGLAYDAWELYCQREEQYEYFASLLGRVQRSPWLLQWTKVL